MQLYCFPPLSKKAQPPSKSKLFDHYSKKFIPLECKTCVQYLGLRIDNSLTWKQHIKYVDEKISKTVGIIARLRHFVPLNTLQTIYKALLSSYLSYGIIVWGPAAKTHANQLFLLQKRALRLMHFGHYTAHAIPYFCPLIFFP